ncbi:hypothetical protein KW797_02945 [Candidatus Parcubacteria bacterium]|nr:hypothetical protein [Candidatus Parcubacteria bacterium]
MPAPKKKAPAPKKKALLPNAAAPVPGTRAFAYHVTEHFVSMVELLKSSLPEDSFGDFCAFIVGCKFEETETEPFGIAIQARGNILITVRTIANILDLSAINLIDEEKGITYEDALTHVLALLQHELQTSERKAKVDMKNMP